MKHFVLILILLFSTSIELQAKDIKQMISEAENAIVATDFETANNIIKKVLKREPNNIDIFKPMIKLDISTMNFGKMLFDYSEYKKRLKRDDDDLLLFASVSLLSMAVVHDNYYVKSAAIKAIGDMGHTNLASFVTPALKDEVTYVRFFAVETLGTFHDDNNLPAFISMLQTEDDPSVKMELLKVIKESKSAKAFKVLTGLKESEDPAIRLTVLGYLGQAGDSSAVELLGGHYKDEDALTRAVAINAMGYISGDEPLKYFKQAMEDKDNQVRAYTADALSKEKSKKRYQILLSMLKDTDPTVRVSVIRSLGKYKNTPKKIFIDALSDNDKYVLIEVFKALRLKGSNAADKTLKRLLTDEDYEIKHSTLGRMAELKNPADLPLIIESLKDPVDRVRIAAVRALGAIKGDMAKKYLITSLNDKNALVQTYAAGNLGGLILKTTPGTVDGRE